MGPRLDRAARWHPCSGTPGRLRVQDNADTRGPTYAPAALSADFRTAWCNHLQLIAGLLGPEFRGLGHRPPSPASPVRPRYLRAGAPIGKGRVVYPQLGSVARLVGDGGRGPHAPRSPPVDHTLQALADAGRGLETEQLLGLLGASKTAGDQLAVARDVDRAQVYSTGQLEQNGRQLVEACLPPAGHVEDVVLDLALERHQVRARHVTHVDQVHGLRPIAVDAGWLAGIDPVQEMHDDVHVPGLAGSVDIEVAKGHVFQAIFLVEAPQQLLPGYLGRPVEQVVVEWMVLVGRQVEGVAVDRGRGRRDDFLHPGVDAALEDVEGPHHVDLEALARPLLTLPQPHRGLVKHAVDALERLLDRALVTEVALDQPYVAAAHRHLEVLRPAANQAIEHDHLARPSLHQLVDDVGADEPGAAGDQRSLTLNFHALPSPRTPCPAALLPRGEVARTSRSIWPSGILAPPRGERRTRIRICMSRVHDNRSLLTGDQARPRMSALPIS